MNQGERYTVDATLVSASRDATAAGIEQAQAYEGAFAHVLLDELNLHAARTTAILDAVNAVTTLADLKTAWGLLRTFRSGRCNSSRPRFATSWDNLPARLHAAYFDFRRMKR
jgi:hypothetical protein